MKKIVLLSSLLALSFTANSNETSPNRFYVEGGVGNATHTFTSAYNHDEREESSMSFGGKVGVEFNPIYSLEFAYQQYGDVTNKYIQTGGDNYTETLSGMSSMGIYNKWSIPLNPKLNLIARLGISETSLDFIVDNGRGTSEDFNGSALDILEYSVGLEYDINDDIYLGLEYAPLDISIDNPHHLTANDTENSISNIAVSVGYKF